MKKYISFIVLSACSRGVAPLDSDSHGDSTIETDITATEESASPDTDNSNSGTNAQCPLSAIHEAAITVDGNVSDWNGIYPVVSDPLNDNLLDYSGADIAAVYAAYDDVWLFVRIELTEAPSTFFNNGPTPNAGRYWISFDPFAHVGLTHTNDGWALGESGTMGEGISQLGTSVVAVGGTSIELKVLRADLDAADGWLDLRTAMQNCCDDPWYNVDETECRSIAWPPTAAPT